MHRCVLSPTTRRACLTAATFALLAWSASEPAWAQRAPDHRVFPAHALRGELSFTSAMDVQLNGQAERLAPGARIRGADNQLQMSASLIGQRLPVHYVREKTSGLLMDIWVLRPVERSNRLWPTNEAESQSWSFDPAAQTWKRP